MNNTDQNIADENLLNRMETLTNKLNVCQEQLEEIKLHHQKQIATLQSAHKSHSKALKKLVPILKDL